MQIAWLILRWAWAAVMIVYCFLAVIAGKRLHGGEKKINHAILIAMAVLVAIRVVVRRTLGGPAYRLAVVIVGIAAGLAALVVAKMLVTQKADDQIEDESGGNERIQPLKLS